MGMNRRLDDVLVDKELVKTCTVTCTGMHVAPADGLNFMQARQTSFIFYGDSYVYLTDHVLWVWSH